MITILALWVVASANATSLLMLTMPTMALWPSCGPCEASYSRIPRLIADLSSPSTYTNARATTTSNPPPRNIFNQPFVQVMVVLEWTRHRWHRTGRTPTSWPARLFPSLREMVHDCNRDRVSRSKSSAKKERKSSIGVEYRRERLRMSYS